MGGPTKEEAREIILRLTGRKAKGNHLCDVFGCESEWTCDRPGEQDFRYCVCAEHAGIDIEDFLCRLLNGRILARRRRACTGLAGRVAGAIFTEDEEEARAGGDGLVRGSSETQAN